MSVLIVGSCSAADEAARGLIDSGMVVEHIREPAAIAARFAAAPRTFSLALAEDQGGPCANETLITAVEQAVGDVPIVFLRGRGSVPSEFGEPPPLCAIEQTSGGPKILRCALAHARARPDAQPALASALGDRPVVFAYSAPTKSGAGE